MRITTFLNRFIARAMRDAETRDRVFLISLCVFVALHVLVREQLPENTFFYSVLIVVLGALFYGPRLGMAVGLVMVFSNIMFYFGRGGRDIADYLRHGAGIGFVALITAGLVIGRVRELWIERQKELELRREAEARLRDSREGYRELLATARQQARVLTLLEQVQNALARELDQDSILRLVVDITAQVFTYRRVSVYAVEDEYLQVVHEVGYDRVLERIPLSQGVMARCARTAQPTLLEDVTTDPDFLRAASNICSEVCVPLFEGQQLVAVMNIESDCERPLGEDDLHVMLHLAEYIKIALERARLFANIQEHARQMALLNEITSTAVRAHSPADALFQTLTDRLAALIESDGAYLTLWDDVRGVPIPAAAFGQMRETFPRVVFPEGEITATETVLRTGRALVIQDYPSSEFVSPRVRDMFTIHTALVLPLISNQQKLGALLFSYNRAHTFSGEEITLAEQAAAQVALVLTKLLLIQRIEQMAITDELTGLFNRHGLADMGRREFERALRYNRPLSVLMLDIDHFKLVNDTCGHAGGDEVLRRLARICRETLRETDLLVRYGGEEILVLMPENQLASALETAERLRAAISAMQVDVCGQVVRITASCGVAELRADHASLSDLIACADRALYTAKQAGRDQVSAC